MKPERALTLAQHLVDHGLEATITLKRREAAIESYEASLQVSAPVLTVEAMRALVDLLDAENDIQAEVLNGDMRVRLS
jgi:hypothetical protein